jgi:hypothetical protein
MLCKNTLYINKRQNHIDCTQTFDPHCGLSLGAVKGGGGRQTGQLAPASQLKGARKLAKGASKGVSKIKIFGTFFI